MSEQQSGPARPPYPREPNVHSGGVQDPGGDREMPPYSDRQTTGKSSEELEQERGGVGTSDAGPRVVSQAEQGGVSDTDMAPSGPHGVGQTTSTSGESLGSGMSEEAHRSDRLDQGISSSPNIDSESPATSAGDQGG
jgi:hypothetical protein